jgi:hypothetical protein
MFLYHDYEIYFSWEVTLPNLEDIYQRSRQIINLHFQDEEANTFFRNVVIFLIDYTASHTGRQQQHFG